MKFTNIHNYKQPLVDACINDVYVNHGDISISGLISSPRQRQLLKRYNDQIVVDVSNRTFTIMGNAFHYLCAKANMNNHIAEERLKTVIDGWEITGQPDLYSPDGVITDYKTTSVWAVIFGKPEWNKQLNCYKYLFECYGFKVNKLEICAYIRDWNRRRAKLEEKYPKSQVVTIDIPMWTTEEILSWIKERIKIHKEAESLPDNELPLCSDSERWKMDTKYACIKKGQKRAKKVFKTEAEALEYCNSNGLELVKREGEYSKCNEIFCPQAIFCDFYKSLKQGEEQENESD